MKVYIVVINWFIVVLGEMFYILKYYYVKLILYVDNYILNKIILLNKKC